ncbi:uncharacterized protein LOC143214565 [Lasioglossum baleicum]|uniref:uncharacterized protein LOC143214565 n=1 Tax=Lasioglossum baleicum TaxID=434251 RepID=UPI003FCEDC4F
MAPMTRATSAKRRDIHTHTLVDIEECAREESRNRGGGVLGKEEQQGADHLGTFSRKSGTLVDQSPGSSQSAVSRARESSSIAKDRAIHLSAPCDSADDDRSRVSSLHIYVRESVLRHWWVSAAVLSESSTRVLRGRRGGGGLGGCHGGQRGQRTGGGEERERERERGVEGPQFQRTRFEPRTGESLRGGRERTPGKPSQSRLYEFAAILRYRGHSEREIFGSERVKEADRRVSENHDGSRRLAFPPVHEHAPFESFDPAISGLRWYTVASRNKTKLVDEEESSSRIPETRQAFSIIASQVARSGSRNIRRPDPGSRIEDVIEYATTIKDVTDDEAVAVASLFPSQRDVLLRGHQLHRRRGGRRGCGERRGRYRAVV